MTATILQQLQDRRGELLAETSQVEQAIKALRGIKANDTGNAATSQQKSTTLRQRRTTRARPAANGQRRSKPQPPANGQPRGKTARKILDVIRDHPGLSTTQIAEQLGIKANYLYRALPRLEQQGAITHDGNTWEAVGQQELNV